MNDTLDAMSRLHFAGIVVFFLLVGVGILIGIVCDWISIHDDRNDSE